MRLCFEICSVSVLTLLVATAVFPNTRSSIFLSKDEAAAINSSLEEYPLLNRSFEQARDAQKRAFSQPIEVPPPGEAGGYEHERHKQNYRDMRTAGILFRITGDEKYAQFVRELLIKYAQMYPSLGPHPLSRKQAPGKLFHQLLNEAVWLVYVSQAYNCIYDWLNAEERKKFEEDIFRPMVEWLSEEHADQFDRIHNHGTWAVAAVGLMGYVLNDQSLVEKALYGTKKDRKGGFLSQLDLLFSPDGYYMEGPYYIRYALRPFFFFAEAIERHQPELKIYEYRDRILKKVFYSAAQTVFPNGVFPPINDASRTMDVTAPGPLIAHNLAYHRYGPDSNLLALSGIQNQVILNAAGLAVAKDMANLKTAPELNWGSVEFTDGHDGQKGGLGILRMGQGLSQSMLLMKYGVHGEGHGHFDKLHFIFFDQGREVIPDYGFARWINIEPKFGGRYLPENNTYAKQTIAHNTVVVDETTQNRSSRRDADIHSGKRHFFDGADPQVKVMSARADDYYPGVTMQRTLFLIKDARLRHPTVVDLYRLTSAEQHQYDYPIHFRGQLITTNLNYNAAREAQHPLGAEFGYQHIWEQARGQSSDSVKLTWLDGNRYYSLVSSASANTEIIFGRTGANDPSFNLISEPMIILRRLAGDHLFATVIEAHGYFSESGEESDDARGSISSVRVLGHDDIGSVIDIEGKNNLKWRIMVNNGEADSGKSRQVSFAGREFQWVGNYRFEVN